ncbi:MAG: glycosyltransferase family 1 protein, partial [Candidatus Marinimicrobia bacterium]|nr:glycosyltransferase family 1 protein [Candidatus Neomarinimicrobiota bacterium]
AHSLYHIAGSYYRERLGGRASGGGLLGALFERLLAHETPTASRLRIWVPAVLRRWVGRRRMRGMGEIERLLLAEFQARRLNMPAAPPPGASRFPELARLGHALSYACLRRFSEQLERGRLIEGLQALSALGPILLGMAPYLTACAAQHKDRNFLAAVAARHPAGAGTASATGRRAWLTDTLTDVNGVAHTIKTLASLAQRQNRPITVLTSLDEPPDAAAFNLCNFPPVGRFHLPEYPQQEAVFPPVLDLIAHLEEGGYEQLIISTPGPVGLVGLLAANLLKLPVVGIYHTDFPRYVGLLTEDTLLEDLTWRYMQWFYGRCDRILTPSDTYRTSLQDHGFAPEKLGILSRGVDQTRFRPDLRRTDFWQPYGLNGGLKFLYVGRISREKNLDVLCEAFRRLQTRQAEAALALVGSGPQLDDLSRRYAGHEIAFTGRLEGEALAQAYASADVFVFPSLTDTFGNVVLEAHASGLPAIVADQGAPAEIVSSHHTGLTTDMRDPERLASTMQQLAEDHHLRQELRQRALVRAAASTWEHAFTQLWGHS